LSEVASRCMAIRRLQMSGLVSPGSHTLTGQNYAIDTYYTAEPKWYSEEIDIALQTDGNYKQQPYSVG
jgi:hypothetical protein